MPDFIPPREADRVNWIKQFAVKIAAAATSIGLTSSQASAFQTLADNLDAAYLLTLNGDTRTPANLIAKHQAMDIAVTSARQLVRIVQAFPGTTDEMRRTLLITVPTQRQPIPAPAISPTTEILSVDGHRVTAKIHAPGTTRRGLPEAVDGIAVFSFVGDECPTDPGKFKFESNTTKTTVVIQFPDSVLPGATVWITAMYFNERKMSGLAGTPVSTKINFGGMQETA